MQQQTGPLFVHGNEIRFLPITGDGVCMLKLFWIVIGVLAAFPSCAGCEPSGFVHKLARELNCSEPQAEEKIRRVFSAISAELEAGRAVTIGGFGRFFLYEQSGEKKNGDAGAGKQTRNKQSRQVRPKRFARFRASDVLRARVNGETGK